MKIPNRIVNSFIWVLYPIWVIRLILRILKVINLSWFIIVIPGIIIATVILLSITYEANQGSRKEISSFPD